MTKSASGSGSNNFDGSVLRNSPPKTVLVVLLALVVGLLVGTRLSDFLAPEVDVGPKASSSEPYFIWRVRRNADFAGRSTAVACPPNAITVLILGQSNVANSVGERFKSGRSFDRVGDLCYPSEGPTLGSDGTAGSIWPLVGDAVAAETGRPVVFIGLAFGGTTVAQWTGELGDYAAQQYRDAPVSLVVWHQGEADAATEPTTYATRLTTVLARVHAQFPAAPVLVGQGSLCGTTQRPDITAQQLKIAQGYAVGPATDSVNGWEDRYDGCHFSGIGARKVAKLWAAAIAAALH